MPWAVLTTFFSALPWIFIALAAALASRKSKKLPLAIQAIAAFFAFVFPISSWVFLTLLVALNVPYQPRYYISQSFLLLHWMAFLIFAVGFCWDRFTKA